MTFCNVLKTPNILVLRDFSNGYLNLLHWATKKSFQLNSRQSEAWRKWEDVILHFEISPADDQSLNINDFVKINVAQGQSIDSTEFDDFVPAIRNEHVKWHAESPDLHVLFNTNLMSSNNPLLTLGPYGSLCWKGIANNWSIGQIRTEAFRVFGEDEVLHFLKRLSRLGFVHKIQKLDQAPLGKEKVLKEFNAPDIQAQLFHARIPWYCLWEVTYNCDLECHTCYLPETKNVPPSKEKAFNIAQQIIDSGIFYVCLLGGEPLLRGDLEEIIKKLRQAGIFVKVISNGQKLTLRRAKALAAAGLNQIEISFDGLCRQTHDMSRGEGSFQKALDALKNSQTAKTPRVGMVWTVHSKNIHEVERLPQFMARHKLRECYISPFKKTGARGFSSHFAPALTTDIGKLQHTLAVWEEIHPSLTIVLPGNCSCGRTSVLIGENADVRTCSFDCSTSGNAIMTPLTKIWKSIERQLPESGPYGFCQ